jgi:hypothetical protein
MSLDDRVKGAIDTLLKMFDEDNLDKVTRAVFKGNEIPADNWSFLNRLIMYLNGTDDARGFRQWQQVNRYVKKGSTAFYILAPLITKFKDKDTDEEHSTIQGFKAVPVFRIEDTDGEPVVTKPYDLNIPCEFDGIIKDLGLNVKAVSFGSRGSYGWYAPARKDIRLASPDIAVFLHELSHAVDDRFNKLKLGQHKDQEVTAEFSAAVVAHLLGYKIAYDNVREYIEHYSTKELMQCLGRIEKIVTFIVERTQASGMDQTILLAA